MKKGICLLCTLLLFALLTACGEAPAQTSEREPADQAAVTLPDFTADTLDGGSFSLADVQAKDVTVINFWALTCGPCIDEMPDLAAFANTLPDNVQLITVCLDGLTGKTEAQKVMETAGFPGATLFRGNDAYRALCSSVVYTPTTIFVDRQGQISGSAIIGRQQDLTGTYTTAINQALEAQGKEGISLDQ